jgi:acyl-CoA synthetase (NDP forming)
VATDVDISKLFNPRSIAIVGASPRPYTAGGAVQRTLSAIGFSGPVFPVNPRYPEVSGLTCYPSLAGIPAPVDAAYIALGAESAVQAAREAAEIGVRAIEIHAAGFADGGPRGEELQAALVALADTHGVAICGPNNMGLLNLHDKSGLWPIPPDNVAPGPVAIIAQSGSAAMVLGEDPRHLGLAYIVTTGNEATLTISDYLEYVVADDRVGMVLMFLETIRDPERFAKAAHQAARLGTALLAVKLGRSEAAQATIVAHTNAIAGSDRIVDSFLRSCGVVRVADFDELLETAQLFRSYPKPPSKRATAILTMSGGEAALAGDLAASTKLNLAHLSKRVRIGLQQDLAAFSLPGNPIDAWGVGWDLGRFTLAVERLLAENTVGIVVAALDAPSSGACDTHIAHDIARLFAQLAPTTEAHFVIINNTEVSGTDAELVSLSRELGIPCLSGLRLGLSATAHWATAAPRPAARADIRPLPANLRLRGRLIGRSFSGIEAARALADVGIPMTSPQIVRTARDAVQASNGLGYPVVMKGHGTGLLHKTEGGFVKLMLGDPRSVQAAYIQIKKNLASTGVSKPTITVEPHERGLELVVGVQVDPQYGLVTTVGLGGIYVELLREASVRVGRVNRRVAQEMLAETLVGRLLGGVRGAPPHDRSAVADTVALLWSFADSLRDEIDSIEINPLLVRERGHGVVGVDAILIAKQSMTVRTP